jgi:hypothetical protein
VNGSKPNAEGISLIVQSESPNSLSIHNWGRVGKRYKEALEATAGEGSAVYVRGYGCRGGWTINNVGEKGMTNLAEALEAEIVVYDYAPNDHDTYPIPSHLAEAPRFVNENGYYSKEV